MKKESYDIGTMFAILMLVNFGWKSLELLFYKQITPRTVDGIIGVILVHSLYCNWKYWLNDKSLK